MLARLRSGISRLFANIRFSYCLISLAASAFLAFGLYNVHAVSQVTEGGVLGMTLLLFGRPFLSLFTNDPAVAQAGMERLTIMSFSYAVSALMDCTIAASRGLGKSVVPMIIVIMGSCVFRVAWVYTVFAYFHTITSLYLLYIFSWTITGVAEALYFARCYRRIAPGIIAPTTA